MKNKKEKGAIIVGLLVALAITGTVVILLIGTAAGVISKFADGPCSGTRTFIMHVVLTGFSQEAYDTYCKALGDGQSGAELEGAGACITVPVGKSWSCLSGKTPTRARPEPGSSGQSVTYEVKKSDTEAIQYTFKDGSKAWRNNNPGNIRSESDFARNHGAIGSNDNFAIFPNYATGYEAIADLLSTEGYNDLSILEGIKKYAPPADGNDPIQYANDIKKWTGLDIDRKIGSLSTDELRMVIDAIVRKEGYIPGKIVTKANECNDPTATNEDMTAEVCTAAGGVIYSGTAVMLPVPYVKQTASGYCGRASQQMVLNFVAPGRNNCKSQSSCPLSVSNLVPYDYKCSVMASRETEVNAAIRSIVDPAIHKPVIVYTNAYGKHIFVLVGYDPALNTADGGTFYVNDTFGGEARSKQTTKMDGHTTTANYIKSIITPQACDMIIRKDAF